MVILIEWMENGGPMIGRFSSYNRAIGFEYVLITTSWICPDH